MRSISIQVSQETNRVSFFDEKIHSIMNIVIFSRSKAIASGLAAATYSAAALIAAKTFYVLEDLLTLPGQCMFYGYIGVSGYS